jgi:L-rhamnose-H+ transport protein
MDANSLLGLSLYVLGGLAGACFYLPFKKVKNWAWESYWMVYAVVGLVVVPWGLAMVVSPNAIAAIRATSWQTLLRCYLFGAMWGVGGLTWGLMIRYLGVGLGLAVGCGLCASAGTLVPPLFEGQFQTLLAADWGIATLVGVGVALAGIILTGAAGMSKERELSEEQKKAAVAEFAFNKGILVAIFSGIMSAGMAFGLHGGRELERAALVATPPTSEMWQGIPLLVVVLLGGFTVNFLWCLYLNVKNKTTGDYLKPNAPIMANLLFAGAAGAIWCSQLIALKMADPKSGSLAFAGWTVLMSSMIIFSTLLGIAMKEWKGVSARTKSLLAASLVILVASLVVVGYGNYLKPATLEGEIVRVDEKSVTVRNDLGKEETVALDSQSVVTIAGKAARPADLKAQQTIKITLPRKGPSRFEAQPSQPVNSTRRL